MLRKGRVTGALYAVEHLAYRKATLISTITDSMAARIVAKGFSPEKVALFRHGVLQELFEVPIEGGGTRFRQMFGLEGKFLVTHCGNMGVKQGLSVVLDAATQGRHLPELVFLLVGDGAARPDLQSVARARDLENVLFLPLQPNEVFLDFLAASDISLITQQRSVSDIVFPSKTETLLAAGRAVIASLNSSSEIANTLKMAGGEIVAAEDPGALLMAVLRLKANPDRRRAMGEVARTYARGRWAGSAMLTEMEARLTQVAAGTSGVSPSIAESSGAKAGDN
jgi:colanic acid biosynthesis glycosyl transferase WcaI